MKPRRIIEEHERVKLSERDSLTYHGFAREPAGPNAKLKKAATRTPKVVMSLPDWFPENDQGRHPSAGEGRRPRP